MPPLTDSADYPQGRFGKSGSPPAALLGLDLAECV